METQVTGTQYICDVCGAVANGDFWIDMHVNDDYIDSYYCQIDLCKECMKNYQYFLEEHPQDMMRFVNARRGEPQCSEINKKTLIRELKRMSRGKTGGRRNDN